MRLLFCGMDFNASARKGASGEVRFFGLHEMNGAVNGGVNGEIAG